MKFDKKNIIVVLSSLVCGIIIGLFFMKLFMQSQSSDVLNIVRQGGYNFINPLLSCDFAENKQFDSYKPITQKFQSYINQHISNGDAQDISVYFRSLNSGHWSGVNENDTYSPASLLKVPLMIAYLKEADLDSKILDKEIVYHQTVDQNSLETFKSQSFIENGQTYSIRDLIKYMIIYSDNNAAQLLQDNVNQNSLSEVYSDLGIPVSQNLSEDIITPKIYSYIFRVLYNATYLSKPMSQYALELLAPADFGGGIKKGLPGSIVSAQKFGERTVLDKDATTGQTTLAYRELHDCGIVYYPQNPYLLCVMTKGADFSKLSSIISDISAMVYQETVSGVLKI